MADEGRQTCRRSEQGIQLDAGVVTHALQRVHHFFAAHIAGRSGRIGATAQTAQRRIELPRARIDRGQHVAQAHAARVMEMQREFQLRPALNRLRGELGDLGGIGHARGVAQRDALHTQIGKALHEAEHLRIRDLALHRATEHAGQRNIHRHLRLLRQRDDLRERSKRLLAGHAQVGEVVRLADRHHQIELVRAGIDRPLCAAHIRHQCGVDHAGHTLDFTHHDFCVAQCRDRGGRCEGRDLDLGQPRERQRIHQRDFVFRGNELLLHLQAIARPDLAHANARVGSIPNRCSGTH